MTVTNPEALGLALLGLALGMFLGYRRARRRMKGGSNA